MSKSDTIQLVLAGGVFGAAYCCYQSAYNAYVLFLHNYASKLDLPLQWMYVGKYVFLRASQEVISSIWIPILLGALTGFVLAKKSSPYAVSLSIDISRLAVSAAVIGFAYWFRQEYERAYACGYWYMDLDANFLQSLFRGELVIPCSISFALLALGTGLLRLAKYFVGKRHQKQETAAL